MKDLACLKWNSMTQSLVRVGPLAMMDSFEVWHNYNSVSTAVIEAIAMFVVNTSEAVWNDYIFKNVLESFDGWSIFILGELLAALEKK